jgi:hypothetical protein
MRTRSCRTTHSCPEMSWSVKAVRSVVNTAVTSAGPAFFGSRRTAQPAEPRGSNTSGFAKSRSRGTSTRSSERHTSCTAVSGAPPICCKLWTCRDPRPGMPVAPERPRFSSSLSFTQHRRGRRNADRQGERHTPYMLERHQFRFLGTQQRRLLPTSLRRGSRGRATPKCDDP